MNSRVCDRKPITTPRELAVELLVQALDSCVYEDFYNTDISSHHIDLAKKIESQLNSYWSSNFLRRLNSSDLRSVKDRTRPFDYAFPLNNKYVKGYVDRLILISLALSQRCYSGFYSVLFNSRIRNLKSRFVNRVNTLSKSEVFPEIFANKTLTPRLQQELSNQFEMEFKTLYQCFSSQLNKLKRRGSLRCPEFFRHGSDVELSDQECYDHYSKMYGKVCFETKNRLRKSYSSPVPTQMILDSDKQYYCISLHKLLWELQNPTPMNPVTRNTLDPFTVKLLKSRYATELELVGMSKRVISS